MTQIITVIYSQGNQSPSHVMAHPRKDQPPPRGTTWLFCYLLPQKRTIQQVSFPDTRKDPHSKSAELLIVVT